jgi:hypothetical protein
VGCKTPQVLILLKASTGIIRSFDTVCLEDLTIQGLMQNGKPALSIGEAGWHQFKPCCSTKPSGTERMFCTSVGLSHHRNYVPIADGSLKNYL